MKCKGKKPRRTKPMASCISSPSVYRWSISACLHFPSVMRDLSCAWPGCGEEAEEILTAAPQSSAAVAAKANLANDTPPCCRRLAFRRGFRVVVRGARGSSKLGGTLQVPRGRVSCHGVWERMRGKRPKGGEARKWRVKGGEFASWWGNETRKCNRRKQSLFFFLSLFSLFLLLSLSLSLLTFATYNNTRYGKPGKGASV